MTTTNQILSSLATVAMAVGCVSKAHPAADSAASVQPRVALLVKLEAKPGHEADVARLLSDGRTFVLDEPGTPYWFATQLGPRTFGIFDAFGDDAARQAHLSGKLAKTLLAKAPELLAVAPTIEPVEILARKDARIGGTEIHVGLVARLEARPGREAAVDDLVRGGVAIVDQEAGTPIWFGIKLGPTTYGIFDAFVDSAARQAHLEGKLAQTLVARAPDLFASAPVIDAVDVIANKLP
jgi:quinol monooxygenase YgiN